jgi:DNA ligase 1
MVMLFRELVEVSKRVNATTSKKEKASLLADCLKQSQGQEIALGASYLAGQIPQGSLGIGWATLQKVSGDFGQQFQTDTMEIA